MIEDRVASKMYKVSFTYSQTVPGEFMNEEPGLSESRDGRIQDLSSCSSVSLLNVHRAFSVLFTPTQKGIERRHGAKADQVVKKRLRDLGVYLRRLGCLFIR